MAVPSNLSVSDLSMLLEADILSGVLAVGDALPGERVLAQDKGVGRPLVREAIRALSTRGLVEIVPGRGTFVREATGFDSFDLVGVSHQRQTTPRQLVEARATIEIRAAELAATNATSAEIGLIEAALTGMDNASGSVERLRFDLAFHLSIVRASGNPVLEGMFGGIASLVVQLMLRSLSDGHTAEISHPTHRLTLEAIRDGDPDTAATVLREHLFVAERTFGDDYDSPLDLATNREAKALLSSYRSLDHFIDSVLGPPPVSSPSPNSSRDSLAT